MSAHGFFVVVETLSFALPSPFGPLTAGGLQVLDILLTDKKESNTNQVLLDAILSVPAALEQFMKKHDMNKLAAKLAATQTWMEQSSDAVTLAEDTPEALRAVLKRQIDALGSLDALHNTFETNLKYLLAMSFADKTGYQMGVTAMHLYLATLTTYICALKLRCELRSHYMETLDAGRRSTEVAELYADVIDFSVKLSYWTDKKHQEFTDWCKKIRTDRLAHVSEVRSEGTDELVANTSGIPWARVVTDYFVDETLGPDKKTICSREHTREKVPSPETSAAYTIISHKAEVEAEHAKYLDGLRTQFASDFRDVTNIMDRLRAQALQLQNLHVRPAPRAPRVGLTGTKWPRAWRWPADVEIRYGLQHQNAKGHSDITWSPWEPGPSAGSACPTVRYVESELSAAARLSTTVTIFREIRKRGSEQAEQKRCANMCPGMLYVDLDPVDGASVCPSVGTVPKVIGWDSAWGDYEPHPQPLTQARYNFVYTNALGQSLDESAWAVQAYWDSRLDGPDGYKPPLPLADGWVVCGEGDRVTLEIFRKRGATGVKVWAQRGPNHVRVPIAGTLTERNRNWIFQEIKM